MSSPEMMILDNARICLGMQECLMFLRWGGDNMKFVFKQVGDKVLVDRSLTEDGSTQQEELSAGRGIEAIFAALMSQMIQALDPETVVINSFEWELNAMPVTVTNAVSHLLPVVLATSRALKGKKFHAKKLVFSHCVPKDFETNIMFILDKKCLKAIERRAVSSRATSPTPVFAFDSFHRHYYKGLTMRFSRIFLESPPFEQVVRRLLQAVISEPSDAYVTYRAPHGTPRETLELFALCESPAQKFHGRLLKRQVFESIVLRHNLNSCGYWITAIRKSHESYVDWESESCGLGEFCTKCTSPFEHDYFMNLPRRLVDEPKWVSVFCAILDETQREACYLKLIDLIKNSEPVKTFISVAEDELADEMSSMKISEAENVEDH